MKRPVWLLSLDSEGFYGVPMTTGGLAAYFAAHGRTAPHTELEVVHFADEAAVRAWLAADWQGRHSATAREAARAGLAPVVALSVYTWNAAIFLEVMHELRRSCPELLVVAGGPHVQAAEVYLREDGIDVVVLGEGEVTFQEWLDCERREGWAEVPGLAFLGEAGALVRSAERPRVAELDSLPSALDVLPLRDAAGNPLYQTATYETTRGCPFKCAFCEWGTGDIGTKMRQVSLARLRRDLTRLVEAGIKDLWFCDSNFGALREDLDKAKLIVELKERTGLPTAFASSWSKNHNQRVQEIVRLLAHNGLITHYNLALQTLTPRALALSNRTNMRVNQFQPVARAMASEGIPIATELIWGLPGDTLVEFERNLDRLITIFPNVNIFAYTLLPGTEFYARREELQLETVEVAGFGKAKGEYVIGCQSFTRQEGLEGYFLITAHILLIRGYLMPLTARLLALDGTVPISALLRAVLRTLLLGLDGAARPIDLDDRIDIYERRAAFYLEFLHQPDRTYRVIAQAVDAWLREHGATDALRQRAAVVIDLDHAFCPRVGKSHRVSLPFGFDAEAVSAALGRMELPSADAFAASPVELEIDHPAHVGEILRDPDGGSWMRGRVRSVARPLPAATPAAT